MGGSNRLIPILPESSQSPELEFLPAFFSLPGKELEAGGEGV
jgi:hypothetical protein